MNLNTFKPGMLRKRLPYKILLIMRLVIIIMTTCLMQVSASGFAQRLTYAKKNTTLAQVFAEIKKQTGYKVLYSDQKVDDSKRINASFKDSPLEEVLEACLKNQPLSYEIDQKTILIKGKEPSFLDRIKDVTLNLFQGQTIDVRGRVVDSLGNGLPGASIKVKNGKGATTSNANGEFYLRNVDENAVLIITYIGYQTKEISTSMSLGNIVLKTSDSKLDEVQIIAYGEINKRFSTSNIGIIKGESISKQPVSNPLLALEGRTPGLYIRQQSGLSVNPVRVSIQGINSMDNGSEPFYVIDGVPFSPQFTNYSLMGGALAGQGGSSFNFINPGDIESVSILKDADATAIYGSRAANGAILITTKKGKPGKTNIDVNLQNGWGSVTKKLDLLNADEYLEIRKEAYVNANQAVPTSATAPASSNFPLTIWDQNRYTDWQEEFVGGTAQYTNLQASVSGGSLNTQFLASFVYIRETTVYPGDLSDQKGNFHLNLNHQSNDRKFTYTFSGSYLQDRNTLNATDLMQSAISLPPNAPALYQADGTLNWEPYPTNPTLFSFINPLSFVLQKYTGNTSNLVANNTMSYEILPGLKLKASAGVNRLQANEIKLNPLNSVNPGLAIRARSASYLSKQINSWILEPQITYSRATVLGNFDVLMGGTLQQSVNDVGGQTGTGYPSDGQLGNLSAATTITSNSVDKAQYKYNAVFGRINYRLKDKYVFNFNLRRDGSSRFGDENQFHTFYSVGGAWLFANESVIKEKFSWLSSGKLRINYGTTGNDQIRDYRYLSLLQSYSLNQVPYLQTTALEPFGIANPFLQWEETKKLNLGIDLGFFDDNIQLDLNYFRNRSSNQLIGYVVPSTTGFDNIDRNFPATIQNTGFEVMLNATLIKRKLFKWSCSFNITVPKNSLIAFPGLESSTYSNKYIIGQPYNIMKVFQYSGVNTTTGLYEFIDNKGQLTSNPSFTTDRTQLVDLNPNFYGGWVHNLQFKGFELDFLFQFTKQRAANYRFGNQPGLTANQPTIVLGRWKKPGDIAEVQQISRATSAATAFSAAQASDAGYSDASFIRLKNASISYSLPAGLLDKIHISRLRVYAQGQNLWTITNYIGSDPETQNIGILPPLKVITLGLQLTL